MSLENLTKEFQQWNPMEKDYKSTEFNQYNSGPGANLDSALQPCRQAMNRDGGKKSQNSSPIPYLLFKNMPPKMTKSALYNICSRHGNVTSVRDSQKCDYFFADFATVADMESTFRALENNNYGFTVYVGRNNKKPILPVVDHYNKENKIQALPPCTTGIDYQGRTYRVSSKQQPRPRLEQNPLVEGDHYMGLPSDAINDDAHSLERESNCEPQMNGKFKYRTGRSHIVMPQTTKDFVTKKHTESSGHYSPSAEMYVHNGDGSERPRNFSKCTHCSRECDTICSRCSAYYCSVECQRSDWQQHRYICGKPKHLQKIPLPKKQSSSPPKEADRCATDVSSTETKPLDQNSPSELYGKNNPQFPRSGNIVTITAISKTNIVFIRSKTYEDNMSYFKTVDGLQTLGKKLKPLSAPPKCGNVVVAKTENQFNRALVLNANNPDKIFVNFMDYGNLDSLRVEDLYEAPDEYAQKPRHALPVMLKDVPDCYMTEEIRSFMYSYLNGINVYIKYKPGDYIETKHVYQVELVDETTQQNLNKMIIKLSKPTEPTSTNDICYKEYLEQKLLPTGQNVELIVMDNSLMTAGCISCSTKPFALEIQKFQKELQTYVESIPKSCYAPRADELCVAKYSEDGLWYRGRCLEVVGDGHPTILFIDYGNISIVHIDNIRRYPSQFTYPIYTVDCEIQGLPEFCNDAIVEKLEELIPHGSIIKCDQVTMVDKDDHFYSISLPNVIQRLTESKLL